MPDATAASQPNGIAYHLRTTSEVALIGLFTLSACALFFVSCFSVLNLHARWGINLESLVVVVCLALPIGAAGLYGYMRQRRLSFWYVLLGWTVAMIGFRFLIDLALPTYMCTYRGDVTSVALMSAAIRSIVVSVAFSVPLALITIYGQRHRMRRSGRA